jgi:putative endopeptidase
MVIKTQKHLKHRKNREPFHTKTKNIKPSINANTLCKQYPLTFDTFENKIEDIFKKNKINIVSTSYNLEKDIIKELKQAVNPSGIKPNNDFYSYINERWISEYELLEKQKYIVQVDDFRLTQDKVYRELIEIVEDFIHNGPENSIKRETIKNAYDALKTRISTKHMTDDAKEYLSFIDTCISENKLWKLLAEVNKNEVISWGSPFVWSLNPDEKNPKKYKCYLEQPQVTLIDIDIYFNYSDDTADERKYKEEHRKNYFVYLAKLFQLVFGENHTFNIKDVYDVEIELINAMSCNLIKKNDPDNYNLISKEEAETMFGFDWNEFCKELGYTYTPSEFITSNVNYLLCGTKHYKKNWNTEKWKTYWIYLYIRQQTRWNAEGQKIYFEFHGKYVKGQEMQVDETIFPVFSMGFLFNTFLSTEYIKKNANVQTLQYVKSMVEDLKTVFKRILKRNRWLQPATKQKAIKKLEHLRLIVGSHEHLEPDPLLNYSNTNSWTNIVKMAHWRCKKAIQLTHKHVVNIPVIDWSELPPKFVGTQPYVVNAYYTPTENSIYVPLGYLQKPFVDLEQRGIEYNLSRIGFTVAHEMSHALDDWGSKYDETGKLNDWWSDNDKRVYAKLQRDVIKQYEKFALYDGIQFNAEPTIGENIADISGLAICQEYLRDFRLKTESILPIQAISYETFFVYFAVQSRQKISKRAILAQLKTNPHPLDKYRCNVPLSRSAIFRALYNVRDNHKMWWHNVNTIWNY